MQCRSDLLKVGQVSAEGKWGIIGVWSGS